MDQERSRELQQSITGEALAMLALGCGEDGVAQYEQAIKLIGTACGIPEEATKKCLDLIAQGKNEPEKLKSGEVGLGEQKDFMANWSAKDTFRVVMDLFQVSVSLNTQAERATMYSLVGELISTQNFEEWLSKEP